MMSQLPYVLLVLFAMPDGSHTVMETAQQYESPLSCSMRAFIQNDPIKDRTYVCVTRSNAEILLQASKSEAIQTTRK
jgi:hypothetical protein